ncbi:MAG: SPOR domain-containing protein [Immundisolibacteraceae bacterium]|nr:SPOR domain-containing protein [Immundisolibacteraceae bacterium]
MTVILLPLVVDYQREPEQRFTPVAVPVPPPYRDYPSRVVPIEIPDAVAEKIEQGVVSRQLAAGAKLPGSEQNIPDPVAQSVEPDQSAVEVGQKMADQASDMARLDKGWVVQVGTFKNPDGAKRLAAQLKALGFVVYIEPLRLSSGAMSRVRIGPELLREDALAQQLRLQEITDFNGAVLRFP